MTFALRHVGRLHPVKWKSGYLGQVSTCIETYLGPSWSSSLTQPLSILECGECQLLFILTAAPCWIIALSLWSSRPQTINASLVWGIKIGALGLILVPSAWFHFHTRTSRGQVEADILISFYFFPHAISNFLSFLFSQKIFSQSISCTSVPKPQLRLCF